MHITKIGLTLLAIASLTLTFWGEAFFIVVYLINLLLTPILKMFSPYQTLFHKTPDYNFLKPFGCVCFPLVRPYKKHKLDFRSDLCLFLGYSKQHKGYKCLNTTAKHISLGMSSLMSRCFQHYFAKAISPHSIESLLPYSSTLIPQISLVTPNTAQSSPPANTHPPVLLLLLLTLLL